MCVCVCVCVCGGTGGELCVMGLHVVNTIWCGAKK